MLDSIIASAPGLIASVVYISAVIIVSQAVFRYLPFRPILLHKKKTVFLIATLIAIPSNVIYWITAPDTFDYCFKFEFMQEQECSVLPGYLLALYQSSLLFLNYLLAQVAYDKLARKLFEKTGFVPKSVSDQPTKEDETQ